MRGFELHSTSISDLGLDRSRVVREAPTRYHRDDIGMQHLWPLIIFSEAPSMVRKSCKRTWLSKASNTLFAEMASYSRISDKVCLELTKSTHVLHYHRRTLLWVHLNLFGKSTLCCARKCACNFVEHGH